MQTGFLRDVGSNTAKLEAEDTSISDGDQLIRTWNLGSSITTNIIDESFGYNERLEGWNTTSKGAGYVGIEAVQPTEKEEDAPLVYSKGQLIKYGINYSDYEADPSKDGYWIYAHTPYNDGENENAAIIYDEDGNITSICGEKITDSAITIEKALEIAKAKGLKTLSKPIERFYVDGKYTVYHWEHDDTSRGIVNGGYSIYDKSSNVAELAFYVQGTATAPWITGISTSPSKVKENEYFSINIGIDDLEKDVLSLTTEVYKDKKLIFTHRKKNINLLDKFDREIIRGGYVFKHQVYTTDPETAKADYFNAYEYRDGYFAYTNQTIRGYNLTTAKMDNIQVCEETYPTKYPVTNTGALPDKAQAGKYEVVCTVRDQTGADFESYTFIVISDGKITGEAYHTEDWEKNIKKYNLSWFKNEINKVIPYNEYMKLKEPRTRGTNIFWSGEKFMLQAAVAGRPTKVTCKINGTTYISNMRSTGRKNEKDETIYEGVLWDKSMINKWGGKAPEELTFTFTATYSGGTIKTHEVRVIVDNMNPYWRLHRVF